MTPPPNTPSPSTTTPLVLSARYLAPSTLPSSPSTQTQVFTHPLPTSLILPSKAPRTTQGTGTGTGSDTPTVRAAYLSELRGAVGAMQGDINVFLTGRMEEDARVQGQGGRNKENEEAEEAEEKGYGEGDGDGDGDGDGEDE